MSEADLDRPPVTTHTGRNEAGRVLAIVGAGPNGTYALERLTAILQTRPPEVPLRIVFFEKSGCWGSGDIYRSTQARTNRMNRFVDQLGFGADESCSDIGELLEERHRPNLYQWCKKKFAETNDPAFDISLNEYPPRYIYGLALEEAFQRFETLISAIDGVVVERVHGEVIDCMHEGEHYALIFCANGQEQKRNGFDEVLFATGHQSMQEAVLADRIDPSMAEAHNHYISYAFPLEANLSVDTVPPGCRLAMVGLGLTAIDTLLHVTEGRGGTFSRDQESGQLEYSACGLEPQEVLGMSRSGLPVWCRPDNYRGKGDAYVPYKPRFFTVENVKKIRALHGIEARMDNGRVVRQIDFDKHVHPLQVLEFALCYYGSILSAGARQKMDDMTAASVDDFIAAPVSDVESQIEIFLAPISAFYRQCIAEDLTDAKRVAVLRKAMPSAFPRHGSSVALNEAECDFAIEAFFFRWADIVDPVSRRMRLTGEDWRTAWLGAVEDDIYAARLGNTMSPIKIACDAALFGANATLTEAIDEGGLTAESHRNFHKKHKREQNRLTNGCGVHAAEKVAALVRAGLLNPGAGPNADWKFDPGTREFVICGPYLGEPARCDKLVEANVHDFVVDRLDRPLYRNLIRRGIVQIWRNPGRTPETDYYPGAIDLPNGFNPISKDGVLQERLSFAGSPIEGYVHFQLRALRPNVNSGVARNAHRWATVFCNRNCYARPSRTVVSPNLDTYE